MALSSEFIDKHIKTWCSNLNHPSHSYRKRWPEFLFHHAPLENALSIVKSDALRARNDPDLSIPRDVAAADVLANREFAHNFVRFYFRPGTPTQYHIEGIRAAGERLYGENTHCPFLVMFVFDAPKIFTLEGVRFSDGNMSTTRTTHDTGEDFFSSLPFEHIYHVGPCDGDIPRNRCAEVLAPSPVTPSDCLRAIFFRSQPEMDTYLYMLGEEASRWTGICSVSVALKVFEKRFSFMEKVTLSGDGVGFTLNHRADMKKVSVRLEVLHQDESVLDSINYANMSAKPPTPNNVWKWSAAIPDGKWLVRIHVNEYLAYFNSHTLESELF